MNNGSRRVAGSAVQTTSNGEAHRLRLRTNIRAGGTLSVQNVPNWMANALGTYCMAVGGSDGEGGTADGGLSYSCTTGDWMV